MSDHIHIYVDACFEDGTYSGIGGALYDNNGTVLAFFREELTAEFISEVKNIVGQISIIEELEMLVLLAAVELWCPLYPSHRVVAFHRQRSC